MASEYDHQKVEKKWSAKWLKEKVYEPDLTGAKKPFYNLMMFPYPSAEGLHVGNMYAFVGSDIYGRKKRMEGFDVFEPIGLDGFGIHSENYAIKIGKHPKELAKESEKNFYRQLEKTGNAFAWDESLETYAPEYYKWTQWIFVQMFKKGLAYRKKATVNWCPKCLTVLADEQVLAGECERCGTKVVKKELEQWFFKITDYAERLLNDLDKIDWSEKVKIAQKNWIGKSEGASIRFPLVDVPGQPDNKHYIEVFTTRPDTLFGATFMAVSPELAKFWLSIGWQASDEVKRYIEESLAKRGGMEVATEKTGVNTGIFAINPATKEKIPVWIADYVVGGYGTGAIMAVPAHDERDFEFAKRLNLPIRHVIEPVFVQTTEPGAVREDLPFVEREAITAIVKHWAEDKYIGLKWKKVDWDTLITGGVENGQTPEIAAVAEIREETGYKNPKLVKELPRMHSKFFHVPKNQNRLAHFHVLYFELENGEKDEISSEENEIHDLLWLSPEEMNVFRLNASHRFAWRQLQEGDGCYAGEGVLVNSGSFDGFSSQEARKKITEFVDGEIKAQYHLRDWLISRQRYWGPPIPMIFCEKCDWQPVPEKDLPVLLPDVKDFRPTGTDKSPLATVEEFVKTKCPKCGGEARRETDVSDTFLDSAWYFFRYIDRKNKGQPFNKLRARKWLPVNMYIGGAEHAVLHLLYTRFLTKVFHDWGLIDFDEPFKKFRAHGLLIKDGAKMSKSKGNVVNPDEYIEKFGADVLRMYLMFLGPFGEGGDFRDESIAGVVRFLARVRNLKPSEDKKTDKETEAVLHQSIKKIGQDIENLHYNTAVSQLMILLSALEKESDKESYKTFLKLLAPFAPFIAEELWSELGEKESIHKSAWPEYEEKKTKTETIEIVVQINGKTRDKFEISAEASEDEIKNKAFGLEKVKSALAGREPQKLIIARGKLVNIVI